MTSPFDNGPRPRPRPRSSPSPSPSPSPRPIPRSRNRKILLGALILVSLAVALGVGLGLGLNRAGDNNGNDNTSPSTSTPNSASSSGSSSTPTGSPTAKSLWKPEAGLSWQIVLAYTLNDTTADTAVYDIDLFTNSAATIAALQAKRRRVICYFSAGSYESFRPDSGQFHPSDYGKPLVGWRGENWLDTTSSNVHQIMLTRLDLALSKGCDGVDPDNVDGYDNDTGFNLSKADAVNYMTFLAEAANSRKLSIGLKNAGGIVPLVLDKMQFAVNEQCVQYAECKLFRPFVDAGKPVFHIEYPSGAPNVGAATKTGLCSDISRKGFSTILKEMELYNWLQAC